jgi:hypothetical protein
MFSPSRQVTGLVVMNFWMTVDFGSRPPAITAQQRSRSVMTPHQLLRLLVDHHWNGTHVALAHQLCNCLRTVSGQTTHRIFAHNFFDLHGYLLSVHALLNLDVIYDSQAVRAQGGNAKRPLVLAFVSHNAT